MVIKIYSSDYDGAFPRYIHDMDKILKIKKLNCPMVGSNENSLNGYGCNIIIGNSEKDFSESGLEWPSMTILVNEVGSCSTSAFSKVRNYYCDQNFYSYSEQDSASRYSGGSNYLFGDSHVKWHTYDQVDCGEEAEGILYSDGTKPTFVVRSRTKIE